MPDNEITRSEAVVKNDAGDGGLQKQLSLLQKWLPYIIVIITGLLYSKAMFGEFTNFDDETFILNNKHIMDLSVDGVKAIFTAITSGKYQPLTNLSFAIEYHFFGFDPFVFHLDNILLHLLSTWAVYKIAMRLSGSYITAVVVSLLFGIHPMHVEEVAWASERKDMMYAVFYLLSLFWYLKYADSGYKIRFYIVSFILFVVSLLSKSEAMSLPLLLVVVDLYKGRKINGRAVIEKLPLLVLSVATVVLSIISQHTDNAFGQVSAATYGLINRVMLAATVPAFYVVKLFAPFQLSAMHYYPDMHNGLLPWMYYVSLPLCIGIIVVIARSGPFRRDMTFGVAFFAVTICVMPQLIFVGPSLTPERYSYIPYIGFFFIIGQVLSGISSPVWKKAGAILFWCFAVMCCGITWKRIDVWKNTEVLMTDMIEKNSDVADCSFFYWLRGNYKLTENRPAEAIEDYTEAIAQRPNYLEAYSNRAAVYFQLGDVKAAIRDYDNAVKISPGHAISYYNRASGKASLGEFEDALRDYNEYLTRVPGDARALTDRGTVRISLKDTIGACEDWRKAARSGNDQALQFLQQFGK